MVSRNTQVQIKSRPIGEFRWRVDFHMEYQEGIEFEVKITDASKRKKASK